LLSQLHWKFNCPPLLKTNKTFLLPIKISSNTSSKLVLKSEAMILAAVHHHISHCKVTQLFVLPQTTACSRADLLGLLRCRPYHIQYIPEDILCSCSKQINVLYSACNIMTSLTNSNILSPFQNFKNCLICYYKRTEHFWCPTIAYDASIYKHSIHDGAILWSNWLKITDSQWIKCSISKVARKYKFYQCLCVTVFTVSNSFLCANNVMNNRKIGNR